MSQSILKRAVLLGLLVAFANHGAMAQDPPAPPVAVLMPCADIPCGLLFDWGPGKTAGSYGTDRPYGMGDDFEAGVRRALLAHGVQLRTSETASLTITIRPRVDMRAMCDAVAGTGTRYSCHVVSDVAISFVSGDPALKTPGAQRLANRCGGERVYLTMSQFGQYVGEMLWFSITPASARERRPALRC